MPWLQLLAASALLIFLAAASDIDPRRETIASYLGSDDAELTEARLGMEQIAVEEQTAACMLRQGLTYVPHVVPPPTEAGLALSPQEFAAVYGFGVVNVPAGPSLDPSVNPNQQIVSELSAAERRAYLSALYGETGEADAPAPAGAPRDRYGGGCAGEANRAIYGRRDELWTELASELQALAAAVVSDPRSVEADRAWAECMRHGGLGIDSVEQLDDYVTDLLPKSVRQAHTLTGQRRTAAIAALLEEERTIAVRVIECDEFVRPLREPIRRDHETSFVARNTATLDRIREELRRYAP